MKHKKCAGCGASMSDGLCSSPCNWSRANVARGVAVERDHLRAELDRVTKERDESFLVIDDLSRHVRAANEIVGTEKMGAMGDLISERDDALARVEKLEAALKETMNACGCTRVNPPSTTPCDPCEICRRALEGK